MANNTNTTSTMTVTYDNGAAWNQWVGTSTATMYIVPGSLRVTPLAATTILTNGWVVEPTRPENSYSEEEMAAFAEADRLAREQRREHREQIALRAEEAQKKAEVLLRSQLTEEQIAELNVSNRFHVTSSRGRRYCINRGRAGNVSRMDDDGRFVFCIHDYVGLPESDTMLAQKLLLEADEERFLQIANRTRL